jgi:hypothetical protein
MIAAVDSIDRSIDAAHKFSMPSPCAVRVAYTYCTFGVTKSRTLEPLAFDEYCRFDTSAFMFLLQV